MTNKDKPIKPEDQADKKYLTETMNTIKVLDHGFVRLVDVMGDDSSIVQAARVSYGKGTQKTTEDRGLIRYLMRHSHTTPFEMVEFKFHCKMPIFVARQWIRHRTANVNEMSGRYSVMPMEYYVPEIKDITNQSKTNKQGGNEFVIPDAPYIRSQIECDMQSLFQSYNQFIKQGVRRELARINLPLSTYTEWYWKIDLHNLLHFLKLRLSDHAQYEIRVYAEAIAKIIQEHVPITWEAFEDYKLNSIIFTGLEIAFFKNLTNFIYPEETLIADFVESGGSKREAKEFLEKLNKLGLRVKE